ncbi:outer membrane protein assembly factor BamB [Parasalinivibrio latis]|uniref:outer membrane protein assembly factor BamB n=1 Tax=Parasalinivibrio latis TaxID=2952610 RepID=UPI0030E327FA
MQKALKRALPLLLALGVLAGCASEEEAVQMAPLPVVKSEFAPKQIWQHQIGDGVGQYFSRLSPAVGYDKIFAADRDGKVYALNSETGKKLWEVNLGEENPALLSGGLTLSYGKVFIGSENGYVIALDEETGETKWKTQVNGEVLAKPLADEGMVVVNTSRGTLVALDAETGEQKWRIGNEVPNLTLRGDSAPVTVGGGVFWGMANGRLGAALMNSGQVLWQIPVGSPKGATEIDRLVDVDSTPVISGDRLYVLGYNGHLFAMDLRSGQPVWKRNYSAYNDFFVAGNRIFLTTDKDHVVAIDARSGTELWENKDLQYRLLTAPVAISGYIVVGDAEGYLHWLDPDTGEFVAQQQINNSGLAVAPVRVDDGYLVMDREGDLRKLQIP